MNGANQRDAIAEVEHQLNLAKRRVEKLQEIEEVWKNLRDSGMPWPGEKKNS